MASENDSPSTLTKKSMVLPARSRSGHRQYDALMKMPFCDSISKLPPSRSLRYAADMRRATEGHARAPAPASFRALRAVAFRGTGLPRSSMRCTSRAGFASLIGTRRAATRLAANLGIERYPWCERRIAKPRGVAPELALHYARRAAGHVA